MANKEQKIPSWLFFPIYFDQFGGKKWNDDKEHLAQRILSALKETATSNYWDEEILKKVLYVNKHDNARGYYPNDKD